MMGDSAKRRGPTLRVVAINDVYSLENLARLRSLVEYCRWVNPADALLVTLAGDFVAPSLLSSIDAGRAMVDCLRMVGVTHATFGNHEDDIPTDALRKRIVELGATWLATNVKFVPPLPASQVVTVGRVRVGLIGVVTTNQADYRREPFGGALLTAAQDAALLETARLVRDEGCACVLPLTHQSLAEDHELARAQQSPPFPVILGGHEHVLVSEKIAETWILKAGSDAHYAAIVDLEWPPEAPPDAAFDIPVVATKMERVADYAPDPIVQSRIDAAMVAVHELETATLLVLPETCVLSSVGARAQQTSMGAFLCSLIRDTLHADVCVINGGGVRGAREYRSRITYGDLKAELPFDNEVVVVPLPGAVLGAAIAASRSQTPAEVGAFLQVDNGTMVDAYGVLTTISGEPVDPNRNYAVALVRELLTGLDSIEPLVRWARAHPLSVPLPGKGRETKLIVVEALALTLWRAMGGFDAIDLDGDRSVTEAEVFAALSRVTGAGASHLSARLVVRAFDTNHDEVVSPEEAASREGSSGTC